MPSSTSRPDSSERRILVMAFAGIVGAPLVWLSALQIGYVLAYQACDEQSTNWVTLPTAVLLAATVATFGIAILAHRRAGRSLEPRPMLTRIGIGVAAMMAVVMIASTIPPLMLQPCD
jgi:ABC-type transport system involved in cytochrome c biogenesis permease subunit